MLKYVVITLEERDMKIWANKESVVHLFLHCLFIHLVNVFKPPSFSFLGLPWNLFGPSWMVGLVPFNKGE